jgi:hypothetical protein
MTIFFFNKLSNPMNYANGNKKKDVCSFKFILFKDYQLNNLDKQSCCNEQMISYTVNLEIRVQKKLPGYVAMDVEPSPTHERGIPLNLK